MLHDLNSTNGTYVNGVRIRQSHALKDGDLIRLGSMNFGFFTGSEFRRVGSPSPNIVRLLSEACVPPTAPMETTEMETTEMDSQDSLPVNLEQTLHFMNRTEFMQE